jgi:hypothetical protein
MNPVFLAMDLIRAGHKTITEMNTLHDLNIYGPYTNMCHMSRLIKLNKGLFCHMLNKVAKLMCEGEKHGDILGLGNNAGWKPKKELVFSGELDGRLVNALRNYHNAAGIAAPDVNEGSAAAGRNRMRAGSLTDIDSDFDSDIDSDCDDE